MVLPQYESISCDKAFVFKLIGSFSLITLAFSDGERSLGVQWFLLADAAYEYN